MEYLSTSSGKIMLAVPAMQLVLQTWFMSFANVHLHTIVTHTITLQVQASFRNTSWTITKAVGSVVPLCVISFKLPR